MMMMKVLYLEIIMLSYYLDEVLTIQKNKKEVLSQSRYFLNEVCLLKHKILQVHTYYT